MASLPEFLSNLDSSTVLLFVVFLVSFAVLFFALMRAFKKNQAIAGVIAGALSFLIVYGMSKMDLSIEGLFSEIGLSEDILTILIPIVIILAVIFIIIKLAKNSLLIFGAILILIGLLVEEKLIPIIAGGILIGIRFFIPKGKWEPKKKEKF